MKRFILLIVTLFSFAQGATSQSNFSIQCICSADVASGSIRGHELPKGIVDANWTGPHDFYSTSWELHGLEDTGTYKLHIRLADGSTVIWDAKLTYCYTIEAEVFDATASTNGAIHIKTDHTGEFIFEWYVYNENHVEALSESGMQLNDIPAGYYGLSITEKNSGCTQSHHFTVSQELISEITRAKREKQVEVTVYPNPCTDYLNINTPDLSGQEGEVFLFSMNSQMVWNAPLQAGSNSFELPAQIINGRYILQVRQGEKTHTQHLIVNR